MKCNSRHVECMLVSSLSHSSKTNFLAILMLISLNSNKENLSIQSVIMAKLKCDYVSFINFAVDFQEEALRQKRLAAAAMSRPDVTSSDSSLSSNDVLTITTVSPDQVTFLVSSPSMWPDAVVKNSHGTFYLKIDVFEVAQRVFIHLGYCCKTICQEKRSKIVTLVPIHPRLLGQSRVKLCHRP